MSDYLAAEVHKRQFGSATEVLLLSYLAAIAHDDGTNIYPSIRSMAERARCSEATARRVVRALIEAGILVHVGERPLRGGGHTREYRIVIPELLNVPLLAYLQEIEEARTPCQNDTPLDLTPCQNDRVRPVKMTGNPVKMTPKKEEKEEEKENLSFDREFETFYARYPRKVAPGAARKAFRSARKKASLSEIMEGVERYARQCERARTEDTFIAHPSTWLNGERWKDAQSTAAPAQQAGRQRTFAERMAAKYEVH